MDETSFPTLQGFVWDKSFFGMNSTQLNGRAIVWGIMIASSVRCILTAFLYEAILLAFGAIPWSSVPSLTLASIFAGMAFAAVMLAATSFVKQDDGFFAIVGRFVIAPMFMFSGTFFPLTALPLYLQWIGWISPVWHATNLGRALSYGMPLEPWLAAVHILYLAVMLVAGMWVASWQFSRRLAQ
jgi:lipooligosaccharide transport system permease protein